MIKISEELWTEIERLLPVRTKRHPQGRPPVPDLVVFRGILFVLQTGCQWKALDQTDICSGSTAHRRFQEWVEAGVFRSLWEHGLHEYDELVGLDWDWQSMDGAMTKAPLGGEKCRPQPYRSRKRRRKAELVD